MDEQAGTPTTCGCAFSGLGFVFGVTIADQGRSCGITTIPNKAPQGPDADQGS